MSAAANPLEAEAFNDGETGSPPRNTSKRADVTFDDSIVASIEEGIPSADTQTCKFADKKSTVKLAREVLDKRLEKKKKNPH